MTVDLISADFVLVPEKEPRPCPGGNWSVPVWLCVTGPRSEPYDMQLFRHVHGENPMDVMTKASALARYLTAAMAAAPRDAKFAKFIEAFSIDKAAEVNTAAGATGFMDLPYNVERAKDYLKNRAPVRKQES